MKIFSAPTPEMAQRQTTNAINQIVLKMTALLSQRGIETVSHPDDADLIISHAGIKFKTRQADICVIHGLYPTGEYNHAPRWWYEVNRDVIETMWHAKEIIVPSQWVADIIKRDMHRDALILPWGVDTDQYRPPRHHMGYVLWNKTREDQVCDPKPVNELAKLAPQVQFISTFGSETPNVRVIGKKPYDEMEKLVTGAAVYLATTKETFGIGILEALACGVPVLGYRHGNLPNLVSHGHTGYLVEPGDIEGLKQGLDYCLQYRDVLSTNARDEAEGFSWENTANIFAHYLERAWEGKQAAQRPYPAGHPHVSIIVPVHNYARYLPDCLNSIRAQFTPFPIEVVICDDASTDNSADVIQEQVKDFPHAVTVIANAKNVGVAETRNKALARARGDLCICIDADDKFGATDVVARLAEAFHDNPRLGIAYTGLAIFTDDDPTPRRANFPPDYDFDKQVRGQNTVPTCAMFRREAWQRAGGYRSAVEPAEDANLWLRIGALGYTGLRVTDEPLFHYRLHSSSLSQSVRSGARPEPKWADMAWCEDGKRPFAAGGNPPNDSWDVFNYDKPLVTVIIPYTRENAQSARETLYSVQAQSLRHTQVIVTWLEGGQDASIAADLDPYLFREVSYYEPASKQEALTLALLYGAESPLVMFLEPGDIFTTTRALEQMVHAYYASGKYIYCDTTHAQYLDYDSRAAIVGQLHGRAALYPVKAFKTALQFDEGIGDIYSNIQAQLAADCVCAKRIAQPLVKYTMHSEPPFLKAVTEFEEMAQPCFDCGGQPMRVKRKPVMNGETVLVRLRHDDPDWFGGVHGGETRTYYSRRKTGEEFYVRTLDAERPTLAPSNGYLEVVQAVAPEPTDPPDPPVSNAAPEPVALATEGDAIEDEAAIVQASAKSNRGRGRKKAEVDAE
jgi:hypothetical protein